MDREDSPTIVEPGDLVDVRPLEQVTPERCGAGVAGDARREDEADPSTSPHELQRTFDEQLVAVGVGAALHAVDARFADEVSQPLRVEPPIPTYAILAAVATHHVPRRVADDGVEPRIVGPAVRAGFEYFRKGERPVQEPLPGGDGSRVDQPRCRDAIRQGVSIREQAIDQCAERAAVGRRAFAEPAGAPQIQYAPPPAERRAGVPERFERAFLRLDDAY